MAILDYIGILGVALSVLCPEFTDGQTVKPFSVEATSFEVDVLVHDEVSLITTTDSPSVARCLLNCHYTGGCESVNFDPANMTCSTYNVTDLNSLTSTIYTGTKLLFVPLSALVLPTPFDGCDSHSCLAGEQCVDAKTKTDCFIGKRAQ